MYKKLIITSNKSTSYKIILPLYLALATIFTAWKFKASLVQVPNTRAQSQVRIGVQHRRQARYVLNLTLSLVIR